MMMTMKWFAKGTLAVALAALFTGAFASGCAVDVKGDQCPLADAYQTDDGDTYCEDPLAPENCERLVDTLIDRTSDCSGLDRQSIEEEFDAPFNCDDAVATTTAFEDCVSELEEAECDGSAPVLPDSCTGVVRTAQ